MAPDKETEKAKRTAYALLGARDYTVGRLREKLEKKGFGEECIAGVLADLARQGFLDDRRYARRLVERSLRGKPAGRRKLAFDLKNKGIGPQIAEEVLAEFAGELGTQDAAVEALRRQGWRYRGMDEERAKRRMFGFLARRGFDREPAARAVDQVWKETAEDEIQGN